MPVIEFFFGRKDADRYDVWLEEHQNDGFIVNNFRKDGKKVSENKAAMHEASCPNMTKFGKYARIEKYGKLCGLDKSALIAECIIRTGIPPTTKCNLCFKRPAKK